MGFILYYFLTAQRHSHSSQKSLRYNLKRGPCLCLGSLCHQPEKFQNWHLLSFPFYENFCHWPWGQLEENYISPASLFLLSEEVSIMFYSWLNIGTNPVSSANTVYHLPHLGPEINKTLSWPETSLPSTFKSVT